MFSDQDIDNLESKVAELSAFAVDKAYSEALKAGLSVVVRSDTESSIVEIFPDGRQQFIKKIGAPLDAAVGTIVKIP